MHNKKVLYLFFLYVFVFCICFSLCFVFVFVFLYGLLLYLFFSMFRTHYTSHICAIGTRAVRGRNPSLLITQLLLAQLILRLYRSFNHTCLWIPCSHLLLCLGVIQRIPCLPVGHAFMHELLTLRCLFL